MVRYALVVALLLGTGSAAAAADLDSSYQALKDAQAKKDPAEVKKAATEAYAAAQEVANEPAPQSTAAADQDAWKKRVAYGKEVEEAAEYALYATAIQAQPAEMVDLMATLEKQNPKSKYLDQGYATYLYALAKTGAEAKVPTVVEAGLKNFPDNPDLLMVAANSALEHKQNDRASAYAKRLIAAAGKRAKPEGVDAAEWEKQKAGFLGRGYWIAGMVSAQKNLYVDADKNLRASLPYVKDDKSMEAGALFYLGVVNYQYGKMTLSKARLLEAAKFSDQCAQIEGPYQQQAWHNAQAMKTEAGTMR
ncbi:MAG TPA: hypothetical protein VMA31_12610 [Bryobacteraceae bacterium]|nr:hypothetical protein [Bryobacteraceae bacterium]